MTTKGIYRFLQSFLFFELKSSQFLKLPMACPRQTVNKTAPTNEIIKGAALYILVGIRK
jgi:hypothetical protein